MLKILYICTHNRCRSILSEAITNQRAGGKILAKSAGSASTGKIHPLTLEYLSIAHYSVDGLTSNLWDDEVTKGFIPDLVITVCDNAHGETCPLWLGHIPKVNWSLPDPSKIAESSNIGTCDEDIAKSFSSVIDTIEKRVQRLSKFAELPLAECIEKIKEEAVFL